MEQDKSKELKFLEESTPVTATEDMVIANVQGLPLVVQQRLEVVQQLQQFRGSDRYSEVQRLSARKLGISVRSLQRLVRAYCEEGIGGLKRQVRVDKGEPKTDKQWREFIVKTYRAGNFGSMRISRAQVAVRVAARAMELGIAEYPSRATVYRVLEAEIEKHEQKQRKRSLGWSGSSLVLKTREGLEIKVDHSNQVWQCDHTKLDIFVVDQVGEVLGRPWLTTVVDTHSRCVVGIHLGMEAPSSAVVCLALRHAILPKQYGSAYELSQSWDTYGIPQYLYTDGGKEFNSNHLELVAAELKIVLCQRRYPAEGGIVERPFGTFNSELLSTLPGYTGSDVQKRPKQAEKQASLTLRQLDLYLVRYIVERYNQSLDARSGNQTRIGRWLDELIAQLPLHSERQLDICLMRRSRRVVYRGGYIQFANVQYKGEHLEGYAGTWVVLRYNPWDITSVLIYQSKADLDLFLTRAHAIGLETESLSYAEAVAISRRIRQAGLMVTNQSLLQEVRARDLMSEKLQRQNLKKRNTTQVEMEKLVVDEMPPTNSLVQDSETQINGKQSGLEPVPVKPKKPVPNVRVLDYEQAKREAGFW